MPISIENYKELLIRAGAATLGVAALGLAKDVHAALSPTLDPAVRVDSPNVQVPTGEYRTINQNGVELTQIYRGEGSNKTTAEIFLYNYASFQEGKEAAKKFVEYFFQPYPLSNHLKDYDFWVRNPAGMENLGCEQSGNCNNRNIGAFEREIDRVISATKMIPQETFVLIKSNDHRAGGQGQVALLGVPPSIKNFVGVVLPTNLIADSQKMNPAHEWGARVGLREDTTDQSSLMGNPNATRFSDQESAWIESIFGNNWVYSHLYPDLAVIPMPTPGLSIGAKIPHPEGTLQARVKIMPAPNKFTGQPDGSAITLTIGSKEMIDGWSKTGLIIPEPVMGVGNYILLPDMTYRWEICVSGLSVPISFNDDKQWTEVEVWPDRRITYPCKTAETKSQKTDLTTISPVTLFGGQETNNLTPNLQWRNSRTNIFYYDIRLSKDRNFNKDPKTAIAAVYEELIHGGMTNPLNSYKVRSNFPLEQGRTYYWQVKPRVQGDGQEIDWKDVVVYEFKTSPTARILSQSELEVIKDRQDHWQEVQRNILNSKTAYEAEFIEQFFDPIYGVKPDTDLGNGNYTASAEDMRKYGYGNHAAILDKKGKVIGWTAYRKEEDLVPAA